MESPSSGSLQSNLSPKKAENVDGAEEQNSEEMDIDFNDESMLFYPGKKSILIHTSKWRVRWDRLLGILILYTAIIDPYRIAFIHALEDDLCRSFSVFDGFDIFIDIVFILNIAVQFRSTFIEYGTYISDLNLIAKHYLRSNFALDFIAALPFSTAILIVILADCTVFEPDAQILSLIRIVRLIRLGRLLRVGTLPSSAVLSIYAALLVNLLYFILVSHWVGCIWFYIAAVKDFPETSSFFLSLPSCSGTTCEDPAYSVDDFDCECEQTLMLENRADAVRYLRSLGWGMSSLAGLGSELVPEETDEVFLSIAIIILGIGLFASILGQINEIILRINSSNRRHQQLAILARDFIESRRLPSDLSRQILRYLKARWRHTNGVDEEDLLSIVPPTLASDIRMHIYRKLISSISLFSVLEWKIPDLLSKVIELIKSLIANEGLTLHEPGRTPSAVYFVGEERCEYVNTLNRVIGVTKGGLFGATRLRQVILPGKGAVDYISKSKVGARVLQTSTIFVLRIEDLEKLGATWPSIWTYLDKHSSAQFIQAIWRLHRIRNLLLMASKKTETKLSGRGGFSLDVSTQRSSAAMKLHAQDIPERD